MPLPTIGWTPAESSIDPAVAAAADAIRDARIAHYKAQTEFVTAQDRLAGLQMRLQMATASADMRRQEYDLAGLANTLMADSGGLEVEDAYLELKNAAVKLEDIVSDIAVARERLGLAEVNVDRTAKRITDAQIEHDGLALTQLAAEAPVLTDIQKRLIQIGRINCEGTYWYGPLRRRTIADYIEDNNIGEIPSADCI